MKKPRNTINKLLKKYSDINYTEVCTSDSDGSIMGYIDTPCVRLTVSYLEDPIGKYIKLTHISINPDFNSVRALDRWSKYGRYQKRGNDLELFSLFPFLDTSSLHTQLSHSILVVLDMIAIIDMWYNEHHANRT